MAKYIRAIRMSSAGNSHEHIAFVKWAEFGVYTEESREAVADRMTNDNQSFWVRVGFNEVEVRVVQGTRILRTVRDAAGLDNLLSLPRF